MHRADVGGATTVLNFFGKVAADEGASELKARRIGMHNTPVYYGRVVRDGAWTVLHQQFFYAMNDWRIAFAGGGSHAGYYQPGKYVTCVEAKAIDSVKRFTSWYRRKLRIAPQPGGFGIPFIDHADGDGVSIGPRAQHDWSPVLFDMSVPWVDPVGDAGLQEFALTSMAAELRTQRLEQLELRAEHRRLQVGRPAPSTMRSHLHRPAMPNPPDL